MCSRIELFKTRETRGTEETRRMFKGSKCPILFFVRKILLRDSLCQNTITKICGIQPSTDVVFDTFIVFIVFTNL